ncbi:MAG: DUF2877 domain-containing protein [Candidatus Limnocylindrales bacterium]
MPPDVTTTVAATRMCEALRGLRDPERPRRTMRVQSVYRSALNLTGGDGTLVTIAVERIGGLPYGILLRETGDLRELGIRPGMTATMGAGHVIVGGALHVDLAAARPWSAVLPRLDARSWPHRATLVHRLVAAQPPRAGVDVVPAARVALDDLGAAIGKGDRPGVVDAAGRLIGLGPGLTPSGDDALAGVEAALHVMGHPLAGSVSDALDDLDRRTTTVSAAMLRHAVMGEAPERVHRLLAAALGPTTLGLVEVIREAVAWGATSGADTLAGVLTALDAATSSIDRWQAA